MKFDFIKTELFNSTINRRAMVGVVIFLFWTAWLLNAPKQSNINKLNKKYFVEVANLPENKIAQSEEEKLSDHEKSLFNDLQFDTEDHSPVVIDDVKVKDIKPKIIVTPVMNFVAQASKVEMYRSLSNVLDLSKSHNIQQLSSKKLAAPLLTASLPGKVKSSSVDSKSSNGLINLSSLSKSNNLPDGQISEEVALESKKLNKDETLAKLELPEYDIKGKLNNTIQAIKESEVKAGSNNNLSDADVSLRVMVDSGIPVKDVKVEQSFNQELQMDWVPRYLKDQIKPVDVEKLSASYEKNHLMTASEIIPAVETTKAAVVSSSPQSIRLVGLIENSVAIIKDTAVNKIQYLMSGESYQGLKLLKINDRTIILGDESQGKHYIKVLNSN